MPETSTLLSFATMPSSTSCLCTVDKRAWLVYSQSRTPEGGSFSDGRRVFGKDLPLSDLFSLPAVLSTIFRFRPRPAEMPTGANTDAASSACPLVRSVSEWSAFVDEVPLASVILLTSKNPVVLHNGSFFRAAFSLASTCWPCSLRLEAAL